jgi:mRNA interferase RelE/StbE
MELQLSKPFNKALLKLPKNIQIQVLNVIENIEAADSFAEIAHFRALEGYSDYYRIRVGQYRLGLYWDGTTFTAERIGSRGDFYKNYPPK